MKSEHQTIPIGGMIEEFRVVRVLGAGNFGIVYQAENVHLDETVAIKEFLPTALARREHDGQIRPISPATAEAYRWARERFLQEARTLWGLGHPEPHRSIVRVTRYREANGSAYMFMEFERGEALSEVLERRQTLPLEELRPIVASLLDGLERVHQAQILHRDIKPANILIRADGSPVFIDFGAARNVALGGETSVFTTYTPRYAALEQQDAAARQGPWTDIYALGATLYRAVTGATPRSASEQLLGPAQEQATVLARGRYPDAFLQAIDAACALRPEDRPQSVEAWRDQLLGSTSQEDTETIVLPRISATDHTQISRHPMPDLQADTRAPPSKTTRPDESPSREKLTPPGSAKPARWLLLSLTVTILVGGSGWLWWSGSLPPPPVDFKGKAFVPTGSEVPPGRSGKEPVSPRSDLADVAPSEVPLTPLPEESAEPVPGMADTPLADAPRETSGTPASQPAPTPLAPSGQEKVSATDLQPITPGEGFADPMQTGGSGPWMIGIPPGEFMMGSPLDESGHHADETLHEERIAQPFALSRTEITIKDFSRFTQATGYRTESDRESACLRIDDAGVELVADLSLSWNVPGYPISDTHPVTCVTWNDAVAYADWLSEQTGRTYRLPTETEWEYAARAGTSTSRFWGDDPGKACRYANIADETVLAGTNTSRWIEGARVNCSDGQVFAAPVGHYAPNPWGLADMIGNLAEWTCSVYDSSYGGNQRLCHAPGHRGGSVPIVLRGGSWLSAPNLARSAARDGLPSNLSLNTIGFRVLATDQPSTGR